MENPQVKDIAPWSCGTVMVGDTLKIRVNPVSAKISMLLLTLFGAAFFAWVTECWPMLAPGLVPVFLFFTRSSIHEVSPSDEWQSAAYRPSSENLEGKQIIVIKTKEGILRFVSDEQRLDGLMGALIKSKARMVFTLSDYFPAEATKHRK